jgi:hypothetical protein
MLIPTLIVCLAISVYGMIVAGLVSSSVKPGVTVGIFFTFLGTYVLSAIEMFNILK